MMAKTEPATIVNYDGIIVVVGEIDASNADQLAANLASAADGGVLVDLSSVGFMDASGVRVLVEEHLRREHSGGVVVLAASRIVHRVMELCGLLEVFRLDASA
jgi:anti-sigma B factor antagonist